MGRGVEESGGAGHFRGVDRAGGSHVGRISGGAAFCGALAGLAVSRAACRCRNKDILGKTVAKSRRGSITGPAGSVALGGVLVLALLLIVGAGARIRGVR